MPKLNDIKILIILNSIKLTNQFLMDFLHRIMRFDNNINTYMIYRRNKILYICFEKPFNLNVKIFFQSLCDFNFHLVIYLQVFVLEIFTIHRCLTLEWILLELWNLSWLFCYLRLRISHPIIKLLHSLQALRIFKIFLWL